VCFINPDDTAVPTVQRCLAGDVYDCVVIGAGVRLPSSQLVLFEAVVNAVHRAAPARVLAADGRRALTERQWKVRHVPNPRGQRDSTGRLFQFDNYFPLGSDFVRVRVEFRLIRSDDDGFIFEGNMSAQARYRPGVFDEVCLERKIMPDGCLPKSHDSNACGKNEPLHVW
jgi:hypothetical protein